MDLTLFSKWETEHLLCFLLAQLLRQFGGSGGSGRVFGHWDELLRQMKGPLFAKAPLELSGEMPPLHSSSAPAPVPLLYLCSFQYLFCTFVLSSTSSVPLQSSTTIHCLLNSYCLKIREEKCLLFKTAVHHTTCIPSLYLNSFQCLKSLSALGAFL